MKTKIWLFQLPLIALFTFAFYITEAGVGGNLEDALLRERAFPFLKTVNGWFTNIKFHMRGPVPPKNKVVIVEVDSSAIAQLGRWPWHRDVTSYLVKKTFDAGAKVVGLDMVFSEPDERVPEELAKLLEAQKLGGLAKQFETDAALRDVIAAYSDRLVLGWMTENWCQPAFRKGDACAVTAPETLEAQPKDFAKFGYSNFNRGNGFDQANTQLLSTVDIMANIPLFSDVAKHAGYFVAWPDDDGYVRRTNLVMTANSVAHPSLPLEMARVGLGEDLRLDLDAAGKVARLGFAKSNRRIPVSPLGVMEVNFRGGPYTFQYVRALEVMGDEDMIQVERDRTIVSVSKSELLKDAYALVGVSALGVFDMRAFPFGSNTPGVEGHANILDNILTGDMLVRGSGPTSPVWMFLLMTLGALFIAVLTEKLESIPALLFFIAALCGFTVFDIKLLFENNINWNTSLFYIELAAIFLFTMSVKYVLEERNKKFIKGAFAKYVSPAIIESIMKDPSKLSVGGEKRDLTILFSDIRGFTTFSEKMDARALAGFLNDYLGIMTDLVFDNEGTLDKYIGDAVMAFWGAPLDQPKHASNACRAAIRMLQALAAHHERFKTQYGVDVQIGIGVNSGSVNVGNMGSERIFEYTVIGDHVNLASRLEGLTKYYGAGIVTSRFTFDDIQKSGEPTPPHRVLDFVKVKGKKTAVELIQVLEREYSPEGLKAFEAGRIFYRNREWDQAIESFREANAKLRPHPDVDDGPSALYIDRCKEFKLQPPDADWDGSWEMTSK